MRTCSAPPTPRQICSCNNEFYAGKLLDLNDMVCRDVFRTAWKSSGVVWGETKKKRSIRARRMMIKGLSETPPKAAERRHKKGSGGGGGGGAVGKKKKRKSADTPLDCCPAPKVLRIKFVRSQTRPENCSSSGHEKVPTFDAKVSIFDDARSRTMTEQAASGMTTRTTTALVGCSSRSTYSMVENAGVDSCVKFLIPDLNIPVVLEDGLYTGTK